VRDEEVCAALLRDCVVVSHEERVKRGIQATAESVMENASGAYRPPSHNEETFET